MLPLALPDLGLSLGAEALVGVSEDLAGRLHAAFGTTHATFGDLVSNGVLSMLAGADGKAVAQLLTQQAISRRSALMTG